MFGRKPILVIAVALVLLAGGCGPGSKKADTPDYWPTEGWRTASPVKHGFDESKLEAIAEIVDRDMPYLDGLIIIRNGYIVHESYFNGYEPGTMHDIASVTKSWTSALVGMAWARGKLTNLDESISALLPDYFGDSKHSDKQAITLEHLLTMRSGIEFDEYLLNTGGYGGEELLAGDVTALALGFPMAHEPGTAWNYSTLDPQLASAIFQHAMGESLASFAASYLFDPMGIAQFDWLADGTGTTIGGQNLSMTPRDMAKLGLLYLHEGIWDGKPMIPAEWVRTSTTPQNHEAYFDPTGQTERIEWYGYYWWTWKPEWHSGYRSFQARGYAGQQVLVFPDLDMIVVTTANLDGVDPDTAEQQEEAIYSTLIRDTIFPALADIDLSRQ